MSKIFTHPTAAYRRRCNRSNGSPLMLKWSRLFFWLPGRRRAHFRLHNSTWRWEIQLRPYFYCAIYSIFLGWSRNSSIWDLYTNYPTNFSWLFYRIRYCPIINTCHRNWRWGRDCWWGAEGDSMRGRCGCLALSGGCRKGKLIRLGPGLYLSGSSRRSSCRSPSLSKWSWRFGLSLMSQSQLLSTRGTVRFGMSTSFMIGFLGYRCCILWGLCRIYRLFYRKRLLPFQ